MPRGGKTKTSFKAGNPGKPKGATNKVNRDIKEAFKNLIEMNLENMTIWLEQVAQDDPYKAMTMIQGLSEYIVPKLARTELTGKDGERFTINHALNEEQQKLLDKLTE